MVRVIKRVGKAIRRRFVILFARTSLEAGFASEARRFYEMLRTFNASVDSDGDIDKMRYTLLREIHVLEKGMSMKSPRLGFGQDKVRALLTRLAKYYKLYKSTDREFCFNPLDTISKYLEFTANSGVDVDELRCMFVSLCGEVGYVPTASNGGVDEHCRESVVAMGKGDFDSLMRSRYSIRYFDQQNPPATQQIKIALELAQRTPSACNRQAWHTHVYRDRQSVELVKWQGGSRGFEDEMTTTILVTADMKGFLWHEVHQAYVDGGLYAMNLINALHYLGMGAIPLSTGFAWEKLKELDQFGVPENEVPILIIGVGNLLPKFKAAASVRKPIARTNVFHEGGIA